MTCPFTQTYAADAASPTCQAFWVQSIWAPHVAHGSDRRSVFSTTVTRLPKLHECEQRVCRRDAFLYGRWIFRRLYRLDLSVGWSSRCGSRSPGCGNRAGVVFCGAQDLRTRHGCRHASQRRLRLRQAPALCLTRIASPILPVRADTSAGGLRGSGRIRAEGLSLYERRTRRRNWTRSPRAPRTLLLAVSLQPGEYRVCVIRYSPELGRTAQADR